MFGSFSAAQNTLQQSVLNQQQAYQGQVQNALMGQYQGLAPYQQYLGCIPPGTITYLKPNGGHIYCEEY